MASISELFERMPGALDAEKAAGFSGTIQFDLSGEGGGQWHVTVANGQVESAKGQAEAPDATIRMDANDYADMVGGRLNPMTAFIQQKVKVEGDLNKVMKFQTLFNM
jgi:putative sterol carrier protein